MYVKNKVKYYRKKCDLTLKELSELTGVSISAISLIENGKRIPSIFIASRIAKALNVTENNLFPIKK